MMSKIMPVAMKKGTGAFFYAWEISHTLDQLAEETAHCHARPKAISIDDVTSVVDDVTGRLAR